MGVLEVGSVIQKVNTPMSISVKPNRALFDLDLLRAIVVVADCGSFTTAATRLHSTQSTISQKVRRLEDMVGHRLLVRGNRDVLPTDAGRTLLGYARHMLALNDQMLEALAGAMVGVTVRLGYLRISSVGAPPMPCRHSVDAILRSSWRLPAGCAGT